MGLLGLGGFYFCNMHFQGFGGIGIEWMRFFEESTGRIKGIELFLNIGPVRLESFGVIFWNMLSRVWKN